MSTEQPVGTVSAEQLSALMDGDLESGVVAQACRGWRDTAESREIWHRFHLIGDVMRSEDLASTAARDAAFLRGLRERLAAEPVVIAPQALPAAVPGVAVAGARRSRRWGWRAPAAVAAGFVVVAGVLVVTRAPQPAAVEQAAVVPAAAAVVPVAAAEPAVEPQPMVANGQVIRDARLERYLAAHQQFAGTSALGVPSAFLRRATTDAANR